MTIMSEQDFSVPTIPPDLRREETILQITDSLEYLEKVANDVFTRISNRVAENRTRLQQVNDRVSLAQARVDKLKGSNKATKVFASSKYPAEDEQKNYNTLFAATEGGKAMKRKHYKVQSKHPPTDERVLREKLQFFNVHLNTKSKKDVDNKGEGLGGLPHSLPSISSLLLFNTSENPYKKYVMLDPLGVVTKTRAAVTEGAAGPADAPTTIVQNEEMQRQQQENYFYVPDIGNVPEIAVPDFLPNLLGVADDVTFSGDQGSSIAPSVLTTNIPDLPSIGPEPDAVPSGPAAPGGPTDVPASAPPPPPPGPPPPGPPPPPPPGPPPPSAPAPPPPPPPPGPPPPAEGGGAPPDGPAPSGVPEAVAAPSDGRSNLLDAIRAAGGAGKAKLRSAKEKRMESKKKKQEEKEKGPAPSSGGGDLMGDLFAKLSMRRKGISGSGKAGGGGGEKSDSGGGGSGSAMDKISAMIPSPPKPEGGGGGGGDDDDDDWD